MSMPESVQIMFILHYTINFDPNENCELNRASEKKLNNNSFIIYINKHILYIFIFDNFYNLCDIYLNTFFYIFGSGII